MQLRTFYCLLMISLFAGMSGCSSSCDELAEITCTETGADSGECKKARQAASDASAAVKQQCDLALELVHALEKQPN